MEFCVAAARGNSCLELGCGVFGWGRGLLGGGESADLEELDGACGDVAWGDLRCWEADGG